MMSKRVFLSNNGLIVSKPGFDATSNSLTPAQTSLNTRFGKYFSVILQGSIAWSAFTLAHSLQTGNNYDYWYEYVVNFGFTLGASPIVLLTSQDPIQSDGTCVTRAYANDTGQTYYGGDQFSYGTGGAFGMWPIVTGSTLTIHATLNVITYNPGTPAFVNYTVLRTA